MSRSNHWNSPGEWVRLQPELGARWYNPIVRYEIEVPSKWVHNRRSYYKHTQWWVYRLGPGTSPRRRERFNRRWLGWGRSHKDYKRLWNQEYRSYVKRELLRAAKDDYDNLSLAHHHKVTNLWDWL